MLIGITSWDIILLDIVGVAFVLPSTSSVIGWEVIWIRGSFLIGALTFSNLVRIACWDRFSKVSIGIGSMGGVWNRWDVPFSGSTCLFALIRGASWNRHLLVVLSMLLMMVFLLFNLNLGILNRGVSVLIDLDTLGQRKSCNYWNCFLKHIFY